MKSFNIGPTDLFGIRLALSADGRVLAAGAPGQTGGGRGFNANGRLHRTEMGAVYVFRRAAGKWSQAAYVKAPNSDEYDQFGSGVALSGNGAVLAAAANGEDGGSRGIGGNQNDNSVRDSGAIFIF